MHSLNDHAYPSNAISYGTSIAHAVKRVVIVLAIATGISAAFTVFCLQVLAEYTPPVTPPPPVTQGAGTR